MSIRSSADAPGSTSRANMLEPLSGEPGIPNIARPAAVSVSKKGLAAVTLLVLSLAVASTLYVERYFASRKDPSALDSRRAGDRPAASSTDPKRLDMTLPAVASAVSATSSTRIPALVPTSDELGDSIAIHRNGATTSPSPATKSVPPEDAPAMLVLGRPESGGAGRTGRQTSDPQSGSGDELGQTRRNLDNYQRQLQGLLGTVSQSAAVATGSNGPASGSMVAMPPIQGAPTGVPAQSTGGLFGGQLQGSATPRVAARLLGDRSLILPKGTAFTCALKTRIVSAASGLVGCQVQRNVYSDDGRVLLIERGSHMDGEYRIANLRPGAVRIPVLWTRIRTPAGVTVDIESPGTGALGEAGIDGYVDNRWADRIGAALLLSLIDDSVSLLIQRESSGQQGNAVLMPSTTTNTSKLAEKVLDTTINIPPLVYQNQGGIVGIVVARDIDFSSVYELRPVER